MTSQFAAETAITAQPDGTWAASISSSWNINNNSNGGYLLTPALRAMQELSGHPDPLTVTTHFFRPGRGDKEAIVTAEVLKHGRTITTTAGQVIQEGKARLTMLAGFGDLNAQTGADTEAELSIPVPDLPPPENCTDRSLLTQGITVALNSRAEIRVHPDQAKLATSHQSDMLGWVRFRDGADPTTMSLPFFCDAFPPSILTMMGVVGWVPTMELTVHVRRRPEPGWLAAHFWCDDFVKGKMIESGRLWDSTGALVAQSRQIGLLL